MLVSTHCTFIGEMHVCLGKDHAWNCLLVALKRIQMLSLIDDPMIFNFKTLSVPSAINSNSHANIYMSKVVPDRVEIFSDFLTDTRIP